MPCVRRNGNRHGRLGGVACLFIGAIHLAIIFFCLSETVYEVVTKEDRYSMWQELYMSLSQLVGKAITSIVYILQLRQSIIASSVYERIWELVALKEPFNVWTHLHTFLAYLLEFIMAMLLIRAAYTGRALGALLWLILMSPFFVAATLYAFFFYAEDASDQWTLNLVIVGLTWFSWYNVLKFYLSHRPKGKSKFLL